MGSYFKGWYQSLVSRYAPVTPTIDGREPFFGQVLKVTMNGPIEDHGKIIVKIYKQTRFLNEKDIESVAYPLDRNIINYPLPGELVLLTTNITDDNINGYVGQRLYYKTVLSAASSITYNSNPFYLENESRDLNRLPYDLIRYEKRFESRLADTNRFIKKDKVVERPMLKPFEGDFILQSRYGSSIRLGSTSLNEENPWSEYGGKAGNPITILSVKRDLSKTTTIEDIDTDAASLVLCTTQQIDVRLSTSNKLKSFVYKYNAQAATIIGINQDDPKFTPTEFIPPPTNVLNDPTQGIGSNIPTEYTGSTQVGKLIPPTTGPITSGHYRTVGGNFHGALDLGSRAQTDNTIYAAADGIVIKTIWDRQNVPCPDSSQQYGCGGGFGNYVILYHPQFDLYTLYAHMLDMPLVKTKDKVTQGQVLGLMGNSGSSKGKHLHYEVVLPVKLGQGNNEAFTENQKFQKALANHSYSKQYKQDILNIGFYKSVNSRLESV